MPWSALLILVCFLFTIIPHKSLPDNRIFQLNQKSLYSHLSTWRKICGQFLRLVKCGELLVVLKKL